MIAGNELHDYADTIPVAPEAAHGCCEIDDSPPPREPMGMGEAIAIMVVTLMSIVALVSAVAWWWAL